MQETDYGELSFIGFGSDPDYRGGFTGVVWTFLRNTSMGSRKNYTHASERGATLSDFPWRERSDWTRAQNAHIYDRLRSTTKNCYKEICGYGDHDGLRKLRDNKP